MKRHAKAIVAISAMLLTFALGASSTTADTLPTLSTDPASQVGVTTAKLSGTVNPNGVSGDGPVSWRLEYTPSGQGAWSSASSGTIEAPASEAADPVGVEAVLGFNGELQPGASYEFRLVAENGGGVAETPSPYPSFTMDAATAPSLTIAAPSTVTYYEAHVAGTIDPEGGNQNPIGGPLAINWSFQLSTDGGANWFDAAGGEISTSEPEGGGPIPALGNSPIAVEADLVFLSHNTPYEVRLVANYAGNTKQAISAEQSFKTKQVAKPIVSLDPVSAITATTAHFEGSVDPGAPDAAHTTTCQFEYIEDAIYQAQDEVQRLTVKATGGTYALTFGGKEVTAPIAFDASPAAVQAALEGLAAIGPGDVSVSGGPGNLTGSLPYILVFSGALTDTDVADMWVEGNDNNLTGPGKASVTSVASGQVGRNETQQVAIAATAGTYTLAFEGQNTAATAFDASAATVQAALEALPAIGAGNVEVSGGPGDASGSSPYSIVFRGALAETNVKQVVASQGGLTRTGSVIAETPKQGKAPGFGFPIFRVPCGELTGAAKDVELDVERLQPNTTYHVRIFAYNAGGESEQTRSFETDEIPATVVTGKTLERSATTARLEGIVNPNNNPTTYWFEYGTTSAYGNTIPAAMDGAVEAGPDEVPVGFTISGLQPNTTYHYRLVADNGVGGPVAGADRTTTTLASDEVGPGVGALGDRGVELVTEPSKTISATGGGKLSDDGNRVLYRRAAGTDDTSAMGFSSSPLLALRGPNGWVTNGDIVPPRSAFPFGEWGVMAANPELTHFLMANDKPGLTQPSSVVQVDDNGQAGASLGAFFIPVANLFDEQLTQGYAMRGRFGLFPTLPDPVSPELGATSIYRYSVDGIEIAGRLPDESVPSCGFFGRLDFAEGGDNAEDQNWISRDGTRIFFGSTGNDCGSPRQLYMRDAGPGGGMGAGTGASTTLISKPLPGEPPRAAEFIAATPDGSAVFYGSEAKLAAADENETRDVYRYTDAGGNECLTCVVPEAAVAGVGDFFGSSSAVVSQDGSHLYFVSRKQLVPGRGAPRHPLGPNQASLYLLEDGEIKFVSPRLEASPLLFDSSRNWSMTTDGEVFFFASALQLTSQQTQGTTQHYRYDDRDGSLTCVTCRAGFVPLDVDEIAGRASSIEFVDLTPTMSADGDTFAFRASGALVPEDVNDDVDVYEWHDGRIGLITDGTSNYLAGYEVQVGNITPDGKSLLFVAASKLTYDAPTPFLQVFVARVGGGFAAPVTPLPCGGDGCQGGPSTPPGEGSASSAFFSGPANPVKPCAKGTVRKKARCVSKPRKSKKSKKKKARQQSSAKRAGADRGGKR